MVMGRTERAAPVRGRLAGRKAGQKKYSNMKVEKLREIVGDVELLGGNHWAVVGIRYNEWAIDSAVPCRDDAMLKQKYDRLANTSKSTGNPTCPPEVRKANRIARNILAQAQATALGARAGSGDERDSNVDLTEQGDVNK